MGAKARSGLVRCRLKPASEAGPGVAFSARSDNLGGSSRKRRPRSRSALPPHTPPGGGRRALEMKKMLNVGSAVTALALAASAGQAASPFTAGSIIVVQYG